MTKKIIIDKKTLEDLYFNRKLSTHKIAERFNCNPSVIQKRLKEHGMNTRNPKKKINIPKYRLYNLYVKQKLSVTDTAQKLGISHCATYYKLKEKGIEPRKKNILNIKRDELYGLYIKESLSPKKIAEKFNSNKTTVFEKLRKYKIKTKSLSEAKIKYKKARFNGDNLLKAYMVGFRLGDLNVKSNQGGSIFVKSSTTKEDQFNLIKSLYGVYGHFWTKKYGDVHSIEIILDKSFNFLLPKKDNIPSWILKNKEYFFAFLGGYTDAEGNIGVSQNRARFRIRTYDRNILFQIHKNLNKLGVNSKFGTVSRQGVYGMRKQNKDCFGVFVNSKEDLFKLLKFIKPYVKHKKRYGDLIIAEENILERNKKQNANLMT